MDADLRSIAAARRAAERAWDAFLAFRGTPPEAIDEIVAAMAKNGPLAIMMTKQAINRGMDMPLMHGFMQEADLAYMLAWSDDRAEGLKAFAERRPAKFKGQ